MVRRLHSFADEVGRPVEEKRDFELSAVHVLSGAALQLSSLGYLSPADYETALAA